MDATIEVGDVGNDGVDAVESGVPIGTSVLQFHNHATRDGVYVDPLLTAAKASTMHIDPTFVARVSGNVYAQPLYVDDGPGGQAAFIVATESNNVYALDANGAAIWANTSIGAPAARADTCGNIQPLGITGTPALDLARRTIYLDAGRPDATSSNLREHEIHALSLDTGKELGGGWPVKASTVVGHLGGGGTVSFVPAPQNQRGALLIAGDTLYVPYGGHAGDCADSNGVYYHGWVIGVPLDNPAAATGFATASQETGIWAVGGLASDGTNIFAATGNTGGGENCPNPPPMSPPPGWTQQEAVLRFQAGPTWSGKTSDYWAPLDWPCLDNNDVDIGGSNPVLVDLPGGSPQHLVLVFGKDGNAYAIDRANLGGVGNAIATLPLDRGEIKMAAAAYSTPNGTYAAVYCANANNSACPGTQTGNLVAVKITPGNPPKLSIAWCADEQGLGSPIFTTTDGVHDNLVWALGAEISNQLRAWDADTGAVVFAGGSSSDVAAGSHHFGTIIDVKGRILAGADGTLYAFKPR